MIILSYSSQIHNPNVSPNPSGILTKYWAFMLKHGSYTRGCAGWQRRHSWPQRKREGEQSAVTGKSLVMKSYSTVSTTSPLLSITPSSSPKWNPVSFRERGTRGRHCSSSPSSSPLPSHLTVLLNVMSLEECGESLVRLGQQNTHVDVYKHALHATYWYIWITVNYQGSRS